MGSIIIIFFVERENMLQSSLLKFIKVYFIEKISPKQKLQTLLACFFDPRTNECLAEKEYQEAESTMLRLYLRRSTCLQNDQNQPRSGCYKTLFVFKFKYI